MPSSLAVSGLPTVSSRVGRFGEELAIIIDRYDRRRTDRGIERVHQEDACQSLGVMPQIKYQNQGGPGVVDIVNLLRTYSTAREEDPLTFMDAVAFNWLIAGTDAHAKNYSLLIKPFTMEQLEKKVRETLGGTSTRTA